MTQFPCVAAGTWVRSIVRMAASVAFKLCFCITAGLEKIIVSVTGKNATFGLLMISV